MASAAAKRVACRISSGEALCNEPKWFSTMKVGSGTMAVVIAVKNCGFVESGHKNLAKASTLARDMGTPGVGEA